MIQATMSAEHGHRFKANNPFPPENLLRAQEELDNFTHLLESLGIVVYRPDGVDWLKAGGYTGSMPRDGLMTVGSPLIEAPFAWRCRRHEIEMGYANIFAQLGVAGTARICRAPQIIGSDIVYEKGDIGLNGHAGSGDHWAINDSRPAFDAADFMRFGKTTIGQYSHVTNHKGVDYLKAIVPDSYTVEILDVTDEHAMHIDATLLPLREGLLVYNAERVTEEALRKHAVFQNWDLHAYPYPMSPRDKSCLPMYMCSPWLVLNALSLDEKRIVVEAIETRFASWLRDESEMEPVLLPFQHVNSIGGSFHCATADLFKS